MYETVRLEKRVISDSFGGRVWKSVRNCLGFFVKEFRFRRCAFIGIINAYKHNTCKLNGV
jgi:hypothetical protein